MFFMGNKDLYQSDFYDDPRRFADLFNGALFQGREVVKPQELVPSETELVTFSSGKGKKVIRDKVRKWRGQHLAILVLETQSYVDHRMVFRVMLSEAMGYEQQQKEAFREDQQAEIPFTGDEFLSRMKKGRKFLPLVTLILYLGTDRPWEGYTSLYDLLNIEEELKPFVNNFQLNLYDYHDFQNFSQFKTENRILFEALSCAGDEEKMIASMKNHPDWYKNLDQETAKAILGIARIDIDLDTIKEKEVYNMCKAFDDHKESGRIEGKIEGRIEGIKVSLQNLMTNMKLNLEQAMTALGIPEEEKNLYRKTQDK